MDEKEMMNKIKYLIKKKRPLEDILLETGLKEYEVFGFVEMLKQNGWQAEYKDGFFVYQKEQLIKDRDVYKMAAGEKHKLLFISDTHLGSKYDRLDILRYLYDLAEDEEINTVFHVGDLCDGAYPNRPNHTYELRAHGAEEQLEYIVEKYPSKTGIKTMFIGGNHDYSHVRNAGFDIGKAVAKERPDMIYLGQDVADVDYGKTRLRLFHGSKGQSYARCFDEKTEILTDEGWKFFKDLTQKEKVATLNLKEMLFEWQSPIAYVDEEYNGPMIHIKNRSIDSFTTPNHRMLVRRNPIDKKLKGTLKYPQKSHRRANWDWQVKEASELVKTFKRKQEYQMMRGGQTFKGISYDSISIPEIESLHIKNHVGEVDIFDLAEFIGWYVTEGHLALNKKHGTVTISQSLKANPQNVERILALGRRMGFYDVKLSSDKKNINFYSKELAQYINSQCGQGSYEKRLPRWLKECDTDVLQLLFDTMIEGDGFRAQTYCGYGSCSKKLFDDFCEIAVKLGYGITTQERPVKNGMQYCATVTTVQIYPTINKKPETVNYSGRIYCVQVPNSFIFVRRNGRCHWSGNSYRMQKYVEQIPTEEKPDILLMGHYHNSFYMKYADVHCFQVPSTIDQTPYARSLGLNNEKGAWIADLTTDKQGGIMTIEPEFIDFSGQKRLVRRKK